MASSRLTLAIMMLLISVPTTLCLRKRMLIKLSLPRLADIRIPDAKKPQKADEKRALEKARREFEKNFLKSFQELKSLLDSSAPTRSIDDFPSIKDRASPEMIDRMETSRLKTLAIENLVNFMHYNIKQLSPIKAYIYQGKCKDPNNYQAVVPRKFSINHFFKAKRGIKLLSEFYNQFFTYAPLKFVAKRVKNDDSNELVKQVRSLWAKVKSKFSKVVEYFDEELKIDEMLVEISQVECNIKDMMQFFTILNRFHKVYLNRSPGVNAPEIYYKLGDQRELWANVLDKTFNRISWMSLWVKAFKFFDAYLNEAFAQNQVIVRFMEVMINFSQPLTYTVQRFDTINLNLKEIQEKIFGLVKHLEKRPKGHEVSFPDFSEMYARSSILSIVIALVGMLVLFVV